LFTSPVVTSAPQSGAIRVNGHLETQQPLRASFAFNYLRPNNFSTSASFNST
jgi:hypothetical protein